MIKNDDVIVSAENFRNNQVFGHREIVLMQIKRITNIYSQELIKGFMKYSQPNQYGQQEPVAYISDGQISFIQSVEILYDLLKPKFDDTLKDLKADFSKKEDNLNESVKAARKVFQTLCKFLDTLNWLGEEDAED